MGSYRHQTAAFGIQPTLDYPEFILLLNDMFLSKIEARGNIVWINPRDACDPIINANISGNIALIDQGTCVFERKAFMAQEVNASAVIIVFNDNQLKIMMPAENKNVWGGPDPGHPIINPYFSNVHIPVIGITREIGDILKDHLWYKQIRVQWIEDQYQTRFDHDLEGNSSPLSPFKSTGP